MKKQKHSSLLFTLSYSEAWERFAYYALQMLIVLYSMQYFHFSQEQGFSLYGAFITCAFALPFLGGLVADRLLGYVPTIMFGGVLLFIANILLFIPNLTTFYLGLCFFLLGTGFYKANCTVLVGRLYEPKSHLRERGYTYFYMAMNIGATLGPIVFGIFSEKFGWYVGFIINIFGLFTVSLLFGKSFYNLVLLEKNKKKISKKSCLILIIFCSALIFSLFYVLKKSIYFADFLFPPAMILLGFLAWLALKETIRNRQKIFFVIVISFFGMLFFSASFQLGSVLNVFISKNVVNDPHASLLMTSLYPLSVIIMAPVMNFIWRSLEKINKEPSEMGKLFIGLSFSIFAFLSFYLSAFVKLHSTISVFYSIVGIWCFGIGELALMPAIFTMISEFAPDNLQGTLMGTWFLFIAFAGYLSVVFHNISHHIASMDILHRSGYTSEFLISALLMFFITMIYFCLLPFITKSRQSVESIS